MNEQRPDSDNKKVSDIEKIAFANKIRDFLFSVSSAIITTKKVVEFQMNSDYDFSSKNVGLGNFHLFLKLRSGAVLHLKIYAQHMLESGDFDGKQICVSLKRKNEFKVNGGEHLPLYNWYDWDTKLIAKNIEDIIDRDHL